MNNLRAASCLDFGLPMILYSREARRGKPGVERLPVDVLTRCDYLIDPFCINVYLFAT